MPLRQKRKPPVCRGFFARWAFTVRRAADPPTVELQPDCLRAAVNQSDDLLGCGPIPSLDDMHVAVQGDPDQRVTEPLLHHFGVHTRLESQRGPRVTCGGVSTTATRPASRSPFAQRTPRTSDLRMPGENALSDRIGERPVKDPVGVPNRFRGTHPGCGEWPSWFPDKDRDRLADRDRRVHDHTGCRPVDLTVTGRVGEETSIVEKGDSLHHGGDVHRR